MKIIKTQKFIMWAATSIFLGSLPFIVNFLVLFIAADTHIYKILRPNDLMFFVITLNATSMLELLLKKSSIKPVISILYTIFLFVLAIVSALFLGISSFYNTLSPAYFPYIHFAPVQSRLICGCLIVCFLALVITFSLQIYLCFFLGEQLGKNST